MSRAPVEGWSIHSVPVHNVREIHRCVATAKKPVATTAAVRSVTIGRDHLEGDRRDEVVAQTHGRLVACRSP